MKMNDEKQLPVNQEIAWQALNDIALLQACIPGCESIEMKESGEYDLRITAAIGPVRAKFKGVMSMKDVIAPVSYTLVFSGQGGAVGYGRGEAQVVLSSLGPDSTLMKYTATASVGGKLAQVGARLIDMAAEKMSGDFFGAFLSELNKRYAPAKLETSIVTEEKLPGDSDQKVGLWASLVGWLKALFSKSSTT